MQHASAQQDYPARPIRVVVPYAPGGITDGVTRIFAQAIDPFWKDGVAQCGRVIEQAQVKIED